MIIIVRYNYSLFVILCYIYIVTVFSSNTNIIMLKKPNFQGFDNTMSTTIPHLLRQGNACVVQGKGAHKFTIIWLHGLGDSYNGFEDMFEGLNLPNTKVVIPNAPVQPVTINGGMKMPAWYDIFQLGNDVSLPRKEDEKGISSSSSYIQQLLDHESGLISGGSRAIMLGGFSQGAAMSIYSGLSYSQRLMGIMSCSGYVVQAHNYPSIINSENSNTPIFAYHGKHDQVVLPQLAQAGYDILKKNRISIEVEYENYLPHSMSQTELKKLEEFIKVQQNKHLEAMKI